MKISKLLSCLALLLFFKNALYAQKDIVINKQEKGYFNLTEAGYYSGLSSKTIQTGPNSTRSTSQTLYALSLRNINGYFLNNHLSLGLGLGADGFQIEDGGFYNTFQIFGDVRYYFKNAKSTWFVYGNLGRAVVIDDGFQKGLSGGGGIGLKFMISNKTGLTTSFGYNEQEIKTVPQIKERLPAFAFRLGLLF